MKTAVSIPDKTFKKAEKFAKKTGDSRSKLYAKALEDFMKRAEDELITANYNQVYSEVDSSPDPMLSSLQRKTLPKDTW